MRRFLFIALLLVAVARHVAPRRTCACRTSRVRSSSPSSATAASPEAAQTAIAKQMANWRARFPFEFVLMTGDNLYGTRAAARLREEVLDPVQAADRRRREVLRVARQPRRRGTDSVQAVQHGRQEVLQLQAEERRAVLRDRLQLRRRQAARVAGQGAGGQRVGLEDRVLPPSALFIRRHARIGRPRSASCSSRSS